VFYAKRAEAAEEGPHEGRASSKEGFRGVETTGQARTVGRGNGPRRGDV